MTASKDEYQPASYAGISIFADQTLTYQVALQKTLVHIANVTSRSTGSLVKPGTTVDVYAVNEATAKQVQLASGGNNIDSAYSAIYSVPGVNSMPGNFGFGQVFYIHGSSYNQIGYEFDGIPVNRAFDNYNANSLSNLGTVSTEVYTGGGPAAGSSATLGGYINQVIKTGSYPGYVTLGGGIGAPAFYHRAQVEAGGATPDRLFSYYVGIRGADSIPNQIDSQNGGDLNQDGDNQYGITGTPTNVSLIPLSAFGIASTRGPWSTCLPNGTAPAGSSAFSPLVASAFYGQKSLASCEVYGPILGSLTTALRGNDLSDRENVINLHFGVPHHNDGGRDDVQVLYDNFYYQTTTWDNVATNGGLPFTENAFAGAGNPNGTGLYNTFLGNALGQPGAQFLPPAQMPQYSGVCAYINLYALFGISTPCPSTGYSPMPYADAYQVVGAHFGQAATGSPDIVAPYLFPSSPTDRAFGSGFSPYQVSNTGNNGSIIKLQFTKNFGSNAFLRIFGYTFYSDWLQTDPNHGLAPFLTGAGTEADYELYTHTGGGGFQFADQVNSSNLVTLTSNYVTANYERLNNLQYEFTPNGTSIASLVNGNTCYSGESNNPTGGNPKKNPPRIDGSYPLRSSDRESGLVSVGSYNRNDRSSSGRLASRRCRSGRGGRRYVAAESEFGTLRQQEHSRTAFHERRAAGRVSAERPVGYQRWHSIRELRLCARRRQFAGASLLVRSDQRYRMRRSERLKASSGNGLYRRRVPVRGRAPEPFRLLHHSRGASMRDRPAHPSSALPSGSGRRSAIDARRNGDHHGHDLLAARRLHVYGEPEHGPPVLIRPLHAADADLLRASPHVRRRFPDGVKPLRLVVL